MIGERDLCLQDIESRNGAGFETILLIFQLAFQEVDGFFLHCNQRAIENHLIELCFHGGDHLIDTVSKCEISAVSLEESAANRAKSAVIKNQLGAGDADRIGSVRLAGSRAGDLSTSPAAS